MLRRKVRVVDEVFCAETTNAREKRVFNGFELPGDEVTRPCVMRAVYMFWLRMPAEPSMQAGRGWLGSKMLAAFSVSAPGLPADASCGPGGSPAPGAPSRFARLIATVGGVYSLQLCPASGGRTSRLSVHT